MRAKMTWNSEGLFIAAEFLWLVYYLQKEYQRKNQAYATDLSELGLTETAFKVEGKENKLSMEATSRQFMEYISSDENVYSVNDEGWVQRRKLASE